MKICLVQSQHYDDVNYQLGSVNFVMNKSLISFRLTMRLNFVKAAKGIIVPAIVVFKAINMDHIISTLNIIMTVWLAAACITIAIGVTIFVFHNILL